MGNIVWLIIMVPVSALFTGLGLYAWKRKKPMWFWSGTTVEEKELTDVAAYNRANGIMWLVFSLPLWAGTVLGYLRLKTGGLILIAGCAVGLPGLVIAYQKIYAAYKKQ